MGYKCHYLLIFNVGEDWIRSLRYSRSLDIYLFSNSFVLGSYCQTDCKNITKFMNFCLCLCLTCPIWSYSVAAVADGHSVLLLGPEGGCLSTQSRSIADNGCAAEAPIACV